MYDYDEFGYYYSPLKAIAAFASSVEIPDLVPQNVIDGKPNTRWSSHFSDPQWIAIDLGRTCKIDRVSLRWENAYAKSYSIQASDDNRNWKEVYSTTDGRGNTEWINLLNVEARYLRMYGTRRATQWGYSLWEFEAFGDEIKCDFCKRRKKESLKSITDVDRPDDPEPCLIFENSGNSSGNAEKIT
jgi:hypothetical protein